jgi:mannosylglycoprotein endo-beta-mannosidase
LEFYTENWDIIKLDLKDLLNQRFIPNQVSNQQKPAIVVCLPKSNGDTTPDVFRHISLLTTEYKILARIMARRLRSIMAQHLRSNQFCADPGNFILDAVATVRDAIMYAENTGTPICV